VYNGQHHGINRRVDSFQNEFHNQSFSKLSKIISG